MKIRSTNFTAALLLLSLLVAAPLLGQTSPPPDQPKPADPLPPIGSSKAPFAGQLKELQSKMRAPLATKKDPRAFVLWLQQQGTAENYAALAKVLPPQGMLEVEAKSDWADQDLKIHSKWTASDVADLPQIPEKIRYSHEFTPSVFRGRFISYDAYDHDATDQSEQNTSVRTPPSVDDIQMITVDLARPENRDLQRQLLELGLVWEGIDERSVGPFDLATTIICCSSGWGGFGMDLWIQATDRNPQGFEILKTESRYWE